MLRLLKIVFLALSCQTALADTRILTDREIQVTPTNAAQNDVRFTYGTNDYVEVSVPVTVSARPFRDAILECTNLVHHFSIPIHAIQMPDLVFIYFRMDRQLSRECRLTVTFVRDLRETDYVFSLKDFIPKDE